MSMSTTVWNGCDVGVFLDNASGNLADIGGSSNSVEIDLKREIGEYKSFSSTWKGRIACGRDASIKLKIMASSAQAEALRIALDWYFNGANDSPKTIQIDAPNSNTGSNRISGEVVMEDFSIPLVSDEAKPVMCEISLLPHGALTWATI